MKLKLLFVALFAGALLQAQTTYNLDWETGFNSPEADLTIEVGDTVIWTWTDALPHTVESVSGSSVETFNSGFLTGMGQTFSYTFTVEGVNDYICGVHSNMFGTITVVPSLSIKEFDQTSFSILPNPTSEEIQINLVNPIILGSIQVFDLLGKQMIDEPIQESNQLTIPVQSWKKGIYLVKINSGENTAIKRVVIN
ncbi:T9SS type A sorting domain-containing protein [Mangrovimonas sp. ST2L15]|uniref:cupredoxin domain-containing protein n=1 Tax=Mangrovimonas sp. ST2L15 TaxID=1645916 RepID=UPI0006B68874|nr:T9SS type A sorting domain-containing protein [Mangrovimonas sp. ST2L15]